MIGWQNSRHFFNQWEAKPKPIVTWSQAFSRAWRRLHELALNSDWFIALFASVVIGKSNYFGFGFGFTTVNWKPLYAHNKIKAFLFKKANRNLPG